MAQDAHTFIKSLSTCRCSTAARSSRTTPPACSRSRTSTARSSAAPRSTSTRSARYARPQLPLVALVILDGWGIAPPGPGNAVELADTPVFDRLWRDFPHAQLEASGAAVGLPDGQMGNSEVGHLTIGSGRILFQDLVRVNSAIEDGSFFENPALLGRVRAWRERPSARARLARRRPLAHRPPQGAARARARRRRGSTRSPTAATSRRTRRSGDLAELPADRIATVAGRYYAMDRDNRWDRTQKALEAVTHRRAINRGGDPLAEVQRNYDAGVTDEFIEPIVHRRPAAARPGDRHRDLLQLPARPRRASSPRSCCELGVDLTTMTRYRDDFPFPVAFPEQTVAETLAEVLSEHGIRQLHAAETEKYAHVTYFLNGGREEPWRGRGADPRPLAARRPELRPQAGDVRRRGRRQVVAAIDGGGLGFVVVNFANPDMVGHTGVIPAVVEGGGDGRRLPRPGRRRGRARGRRVPDHRRPWERREDPPRRRNQPAHGPHDEPGPVDSHGAGLRAPRTASCPRSRRRFSPFSGCRRSSQINRQRFVLLDEA